MLRSSLCILLLSLAWGLSAQVHRAHTRPEPVTQYLLKGGWQYTTLAASELPAAYKGGWNAGIALKLPLKGEWWLQPEILYSRRTAGLQHPADGVQAAYEAIYTFSYVSYPILLVYKPNDIVEFQFGPQLSTILSNEVTNTPRGTTASINPSELNKWEYAATAGLEFNVSPLAIGIRYAYGLRELPKTEILQQRLGKITLHGLQLYGALVF